MSDFIKYEEWEDYWCFRPKVELDFSSLKILDYCSYGERKEEIRTVIESHEEAVCPSNKQIEALNFIAQNQSNILNSIFNFYQRFIYPIYEASIDIEADEIANERSELARVFGIKRIEIPNLRASNSSFYYLIKFNFRYDEEHRLYLLFENTAVIDFFGEGDKNYDAITIYQDGLRNEEALLINLYEVPFQSILTTNCYFNESLHFPLKKGAYRVMVKNKENQYSINFYTPVDIEKFSLKQILTLK